MALTTLNDISGQRFGRLQVLSFVPNLTRYAKYFCRCDCGVEKVIDKHALMRGNTVSCGCFQKELAAKKKLVHGHSGINRSKTYNSWASMMDRCEWGGHAGMYAVYGAKGIRVDPKWHDFAAFLEDMGERPDGTSIDRIDNSRGYEPGNCRWANQRQQHLNRSVTRYVFYRGMDVTVYELAELLGLSKSALNSRCQRRGRDYVKAFRSMGINVDYSSMDSEFLHATAADRGVVVYADAAPAVLAA